jgi:hypothetical protein
MEVPPARGAPGPLGRSLRTPPGGIPVPEDLPDRPRLMGGLDQTPSPLSRAGNVARLVPEAKPFDRPMMLLQRREGNQVNPAITREGNP